MALQIGKDVFGLAKQTAKGSAAADPTFSFGLAGGGLRLSVNQEPDKLTSAYLSPAGAYRDKIENGGSIETRAWLKAVGLFFLGALGDCDTSAGEPAVAAVLTTALAGANNDLTFLAKTAGTAGNSITVALVDPSANDQALSVSVNSSAISVSLATGSGGAITSTATQVKNALNAHAGAKALITTSLAPGNSGSGVVTAMAATNLAGGAAASGGGSYTHVFTLGDELPYLTAFDTKGDDSILKVQDCKVDKLEIGWEENRPLSVSLDLMGGAYDGSETSLTSTVDESDTADYFTPVAGTFEFDVDGSTLASADVKAGKITISRSVEAAYFAGSIDAGDVFEGSCEVEVSLTVWPDDMSLWRNVATGAEDGTTIGNDPIYGSFSFEFVHGSASLTIAADHVAFMCDTPDADPEGGPAEVDLAGFAYRSAGTPLTVTLVNTQASY